ncbi:hypothetical protein AAVH_01058 [Aphelenchoides avenae]|nr:hypothetical protein AAVH_01058 [Aphelenchus avenae]
MMVGPPRDQDKDNVVEGQGVLITLAQPPTQARNRKRHRRQTGDSPFGSLFDEWPVEMDRLVMSPEKEKSPPSAAVKSSASSKDAFSGIRIRQYEGDTKKNSTAKAAVSKTQEKKATTTRSRNRSKTSDAVPVVLGKQEDNAPYSLPSAEANNAPAFYEQADSEKPRRAPKPADEEVLGLPPLNERIDLDYANYLRRIAQLYAENPRRAPALPGVNDISNAFDESRNQFLRPFDAEKNPESATTTEPAFQTTTPLFYVIEDPREPRRQRLLKLREQVDGPTTTTTLKPLPRFDSKFELPYIVDKEAAFTLTNGAKVTDYEWIGIYDQCQQRRIPLVSLSNVDPPKEEKIMPISGWSHNVTSYRVHILNCNTLLVPGFVYDGRNSSAHTYFMVGVGQFPENIERQVKAIVVGQRPGEGLRSYRGEDVLLRLPRPYRTFDIDFISIYNTDEQKSYGHVIIPSLLVPPCPEE